MKAPWIIFSLLVALCVVTGYILLLEEVPTLPGADATAGSGAIYLGHGFTHDEFPSMDQGGSGAERHERLFWPALAFGVLTLILMAALMDFGASRSEKLSSLVLPIAIGGVLWALIFSMIMFSYRNYMSEDSPGFFLALPTPTAWFVYGFWPFQLIFVAIYVVAFKRSFITDEDIERFQAILSAKNSKTGSAQ